MFAPECFAFANASRAGVLCYYKKNYSICFSNFILVSFFESVKKYVKKALACLKGSTEFNFS